MQPKLLYPRRSRFAPSDPQVGNSNIESRNPKLLLDGVFKRTCLAKNLREVRGIVKQKVGNAFGVASVALEERPQKGLEERPIGLEDKKAQATAAGCELRVY
jgi:hypothetical protein